ncbi:DUF365 domain-containing protein [Methanoculleus sp. FWC-SCC3]|uniref:DUF365 domain-containing protein n=1 Tax=Methanoculleus methanifontis TaxID=2584086 RepID=A0ABT8M1H5_9EURY|nr:DUF365 domain-containing protein [Methanoculleus sp. FWC-SCC3]MDN7012900.1 DUF365 domain-containing protein [Methanoculleus sp. FWC-SCC3]
MSEIIGVTFPVPKKYTPRFFNEGKTVFIKPATVFKELRSGMKLIFYQSHEDTGYAGEATIKRIVINDDPLAFFETFGDAVFLTREEAKAYVRNQERWQGVRVRKGEGKKRSWMALELENIQKYDTVKKPERFVPVGGRYLRE